MKDEKGELRLYGRKALVTGAGRGIGRAIALRLASEGAVVAVVTRGEEAGRATVKEIGAAGGKADLFVADLGSRAAVDKAMAEVVAKYGGLDIAVHNAGVAEAAPLGETGGDFLDRVTDLNFKAAFWLAEAVLPALRESAVARLLYVSSITGVRNAQIPFAAYGASKAGLNGFIRMAGAELGPLGIRVNGVEPGATLTEAFQSYMGDAGASAFASRLPLRSVTRPEDVAAAIAFLASDDASAITGQTIVVDAGQSLGAAHIAP